MGYILPVNHYDYEQYKIRDLKSNESPHHIERPFKIIYHEINEDEHPDKNTDEQRRTEQSFHEKKRRLIPNQTGPPGWMVHAYDKKGALFNERV